MKLSSFRELTLRQKVLKTEGNSNGTSASESDITKIVSTMTAVTRTRCALLTEECPLVLWSRYIQW